MNYGLGSGKHPYSGMHFGICSCLKDFAEKNGFNHMLKTEHMSVFPNREPGCVCPFCSMSDCQRVCGLE